MVFGLNRTKGSAKLNGWFCFYCVRYILGFS